MIPETIFDKANRSAAMSIYLLSIGIFFAATGNLVAAWLMVGIWATLNAVVVALFMVIRKVFGAPKDN